MQYVRTLNFHVLIITMMLIFVSTLRVVSANETMIYVDPAETDIREVGPTFKINVTISQVNDLAGWEFKLYYPNSILNATKIPVTKIEEGPFLKTAGDTFLIVKSFTDNYNATHGLIWAACTLIGTGSGANGNGTLATITFKTRAFGIGVLHLAETDLIDSQMPSPGHILHTTQDGLIRVTVADIAVTYVTPFKTVIGQNYSQSVNVTVKNKGSNSETFNVTLKASRPEPGTINIHLFGANGSVTNGWGLQADSLTSPGPTITAMKGYIVNLTLTSVDYIKHDFFVDYNGDTNPNPDEPKSPDFPNPPVHPEQTINYQFTANRLGTFKYYCGYAKNIMNGTFIVNDPPMITTEIGRKEITLSTNSSTHLIFLWNTTGFVKGNYTICANADILPDETNTADNTCTSGVVIVTMKGDVNGDKRVDGKDIAYLAKAYNTKPGDPKWDSRADINCDLKVDGKDIALASKNYNKQDP